MEDKALYTQILGIQSPWEIVHVNLDVIKERVDVYVEWPAQTPSPCPTCFKENKENLSRTCGMIDGKKGFGAI